MRVRKFLLFASAGTMVLGISALAAVMGVCSIMVFSPDVLEMLFPPILWTIGSAFVVFCATAVFLRRR